MHFICVGTPQRPGSGGADLSQFEACFAGLAPLLRRPCLVVGKSTVPPGTAAAYSQRLPVAAPAGAGAELAWNPEFLREGHAVADTLRPDRIVAGVWSGRAEATLREVYAEPLAAGVPFLVTDPATAEMVKVAANAFLATKISFINAMAEMCEVTGADVLSLADALGRDPRIGGGRAAARAGFRRRVPAQGHQGAGGPGRGTRRGRGAGVPARDRRDQPAPPHPAGGPGREAAGGRLDGRRVGVLGVAFKPGSDDVRDSPALEVAARIRALGARVAVFDPAAMDRARKVHPELDYTGSVLGAARDADVAAAAHRVAGVRRGRSRRCWPRRSPAGPSWMRGTPWTRTPGATAAGTTAPPAAPATRPAFLTPCPATRPASARTRPGCARPR